MSKYPRYTTVKTNSSNRGIRYVYLGEFAESGALPQALNASVVAHQNNSTQTF